MSDVFNFSRYLTPIACCLEQRRFRELKVISSAELWNIDIFGEELVERLVLWKKFNCIGIILKARRILIRSIFLNRSCTKTIVIVFKWFAASRKILIKVKTEKNLSCLVFHLSMNMHVCKSHFLLDLQLNKQIDNFQKKLEEIEYLSQFTSVKMCAEEGKKRVLNDVRKIKRGTVFPRENVDHQTCSSSPWKFRSEHTRFYRFRFLGFLFEARNGLSGSEESWEASRSVESRIILSVLLFLVSRRFTVATYEREFWIHRSFSWPRCRAPENES